MCAQWQALVVTAIFAGYCATSWSATSSFTQTYRGAAGGSACNTSYAIAGKEPAGGGTHPVFLYFVGTGETYNNTQAMAAVTTMANRGYVAATVRYRNGEFGLCPVIAQKAACIFKPNSANSAVRKVCGRPGADCSKGIVAAGFSQGAIVSILGRNTDARVRAVFGMGALSRYADYNLAACMNNRKHVLSSQRLRIVNGERDILAGGTASLVRSSSQAVTGKSCGSGAYSCLNPNGSGWIMVRNSQVNDKSADHCYPRKWNDCFGSENVLDPNWKSGPGNWALPAGLNWLKKFAPP